MDARTAMKANNARLKAGKPVLPEEIAAARVAAAQQGQRTAAANRLNEHGDDREWQTVDAASGEDETWQDPFASLPEGVTVERVGLVEAIEATAAFLAR